MSTTFSHMRQRNGTYQALLDAIEQNNGILSGELVIVNSGDPNTPSGKAVYFKPASGDPIRLANAEELGETAAAVAVDVPASIAADWDNVKDSYAAEKGTLVNVNGDLYFLCNILENNNELSYDWILIPDETMIPSTDGLVPKSRKVAGVDLQDDITVAEMKTALGLSGYAKVADAYTNPGTGQLSIDNATAPDTLYIYHNNSGTTIGCMRCAGTVSNSYVKLQIRMLNGSSLTSTDLGLSFRTINYGTTPPTYSAWTKYETTDNKASAVTDDNKQSTTFYPSIKAMVDYVDSAIAAALAAQ